MYLEETSNYIQNETGGEVDYETDDPAESTVSCAWCARVQDPDGEWNEVPKTGRTRFGSRLIRDICCSCHVKVWAPLIAIA